TSAGSWGYRRSTDSSRKSKHLSLRGPTITLVPADTAFEDAPHDALHRPPRLPPPLPRRPGLAARPGPRRRRQEGTALQDLPRRVVAAPRPAGKETDQPRLPRRRQKGLRHRRRRVRQPVLQGQGPRRKVSERAEEALRGQ